MWIALGIGALVVLWLIMSYNRLVSLRARVHNGFSQIDVQLKRRADLIPNLVETVKAYARHEQEVLERVTQARTALMAARGPQEAAAADNMLSGALKTLFAVSENYPELKANQNFLMLQEELAGTENKVAYSRQAYNDAVMMYNTARQTFPTNLVAGPFGFAPAEHYTIPAADREPVRVQF